MLDYHLHLWPHSQSDAQTTVDQVAAYCERAAARGVTEIAVTEHLFRFTQAKDRLGGFWDDLPGDELRPGMAAYWDHHARVDLDDYVEVVEAVKAAGLPVVLGLEVDYYQDRMDDVADLLAGYPFDVLLGSVHWLGTWRFDVLSDPQVLAEWDHRDIDQVWEEYTRAMEELGGLGGVRRVRPPGPGQDRRAGPRRPRRVLRPHHRGGGAVGHGRRGVLGRLAQAGGGGVPGPSAAPKRFVDHGVPLTTASDAHTLPDVAERADDLRALLADAGVDTLRGFRDRQPHDIAVAHPSADGPGPGGPDRWPRPPSWHSSAPTWTRISSPISSACSARGASWPTSRSPTWC